jgi:hypothetical protein
LLILTLLERGQQKDPVTDKGRFVDTVCDEKDRATGPVADTQRFLLQQLSRLYVQRREWLIHQHHARLGGKNAG